MTTLTDFLLARIAEDEHRLDVPEFDEVDSARGPGWGNRGDCPICGAYGSDGTEVVTEEAWWEHAESAHQRSRVLAECEAKRRIVEKEASSRRMHRRVPWHRMEGGGDFFRLRDKRGDVIAEGEEADKLFNEHSDPTTDTPTLRILAQVYADHPDYQPEWSTND